MLVKQILAGKPSQGTLWVHPNSRVEDAVKVMSDKRVGAVVVSEDGDRLDGILSERDIVRELGKQGQAILNGPVHALMTKKLVTCTEQETSDTVMQMMTDGRFRHMPVMRGETLLGLISIGDVVKARLTELTMEKAALEGMIMGH